MDFKVTPHLNFQGQARAALDFYRDAFEGEQTVVAGRAYDPKTNIFFVALDGSSAEEVGERWAALAEVGAVLNPLGPSAWSPLYGMLPNRTGSA